MRKKLLFFLIMICCFVVSVDAANSRFTLVIDAGHGGHDAGAVGAVTKEKNLTLRYALAFGRMVETNCPDVKVVYTRKTDRFVELYRRAEIANQNKADLFISIHINALPRGRVARGFQTYTLGTSKRTGKKTGVFENLEVAKRENSVILLEKDYKQTYQGYDPNSPESNIMFEFIQDKNMENSVELAKYMQRYVCQATGRQNMGAQQDNLAVLRLSSMPGCLVECGFISTRDEEQFMNSKEAEDRYARGFFNAFLAYRKKHGGNITIPFQPEPESRNRIVEIPQIVPQEQVSVPHEKVRGTREKVRAAQEDVSAPQDLQRPVQEDKMVPQEQIMVVRSKRESARQEPVRQEPVRQEPVRQEPVKEEPVQTRQLAEEPAEAPVVKVVPIFKVQFLVSSIPLKEAHARFKGLADVSSYQEGGLYKYTVGASENYNEILRLRRQVTEKFPEAFIIAFKNGNKMDVNAAIREFKSNRNR